MKKKKPGNLFFTTIASILIIIFASIFLIVYIIFITPFELIVYWKSAYHKETKKRYRIAICLDIQYLVYNALRKQGLTVDTLHCDFINADCLILIINDQKIAFIERWFERIIIKDFVTYVLLKNGEPEVLLEDLMLATANQLDVDVCYVYVDEINIEGDMLDLCNNVISYQYKKQIIEKVVQIVKKLEGEV